MIAAPVALLLAGAVGVNSFAHISKTAGACPIRHPAFCSSRALQAPVTRDLGHDGKLDDRAQAARLARTAVDMGEIGRAHVCTPVTNAHLVCRLLLEKNHNK